MAAGGRSPFLTAALPQRPGAFVSPSPPWLPHGHGQVEAREGAKEEAAGGQVRGGEAKGRAPPGPACSPKLLRAAAEGEVELLYREPKWKFPPQLPAPPRRRR